MEATPQRFLLPVPSLGVPEPWTVGAVTIHPGSKASDLISDSPPASYPDGTPNEIVDEILASADGGAIAEVEQAGIDEALEAVNASLGVLRLFQASRRQFTETTFGMPGDLQPAVIQYVVTGKWATFGATRKGHYEGYSFSADSLEDWNTSPAFQYLSRALVSQEDDGARRAVTGALLFDRAALELRADLKMIGFTSALEAWLLVRRGQAQTKRLARHVSWFGCGAHNGELCGRARPICPYLHLSPDEPADRRRLDRLQALGNSYTAWRCSEWHRVTDWYEARSDAAHGGLNTVEPSHASQAEFWISHMLVEPILIWLRDHPVRPVEDLEQLLSSNADPASWPQMLTALDTNPPPTSPPR
jgi:hypothetical protein